MLGVGRVLTPYSSMRDYSRMKTAVDIDQTVGSKGSFLLVLAMWTGMMPAWVSFAAAETRQQRLRFSRVSGLRVADAPAAISEGAEGSVCIGIPGPEGSLTIVGRDTSQTVIEGNLGGSAMAGGGAIWYVRDGTLFSMDPEKPELSSDQTEQFGGAPAGMGRIFAGRAGSIWVEGCPNFRDECGRFIPSPICPIPGPAPVPQGMDAFGNLWGVMREKGDPKKAWIVACLESVPSRWTVFGSGDGLPPGSWTAVVADELGYVWAVGESGVMRLDPRKHHEGWQAPAVDEIRDQSVTASGLTAHGRLVVCTGAGSIFELEWHSKEMARKLDATGLPDKPIRAFHWDRAGSVWVAAGDSVYRTDPVADPAFEKWQPRPRMPYPVHDVFGAVADSLIYVPGGLAPHGYPPTLTCFSDMFVYSPGARRWSLTRPMSPARCYSGVAAINDEIWVVGGAVDAGGRRNQTSRVERYSIKKNKWGRGPDLDVPRMECIVLEAAGRIYAIGGTGAPESLTTAVSIAPHEKTWRKEKDVPVPVKQTAGCVLDGEIYIHASGIGLIAYDVAKQEWSSDLPKPESSPRAALVAAHKGEVWVMGGRSTKTPKATMIFNPATGKWRSGPDMPAGKSWGAAASVDGRLIISGGAYRPDERNHFIFTDTTYELAE